MNLTLHLVLNDLRRMRVWLVGWTGVLLLSPLIGYVVATRDQSGVSEWHLPDQVTILTLLQVFVGYMLSLILLHEHRIVGTNQFWLTRPITRGRLLRAKAIGLFLTLGLWPAIVALPWWLWCGFSAGQLIDAAAETIVVMMLIALAAALMAVLTDSFARALLWTVVLVAMLSFGLVYFTIVNVATVGAGREHSLVIARSIVAVVAIAAVMLGVVVTQFFLRRRGWWLGLAGALTMVLLTAASRWPWGWFPDDPVEINAGLSDGVKLRFDRATAGPLGETDEQSKQELRTQFVLSGVPEELEAFSVGAKQKWRSGSLVFDQNVRDWSLTFPNRGRRHDDDETNRWFIQNSDTIWSNQLAEGEVGLRVSSYLPPSIVARYKLEPPDYQARLWWQLARWQTLLEIPLVPGQRRTRNGEGVRIASVVRDSLYPEVTFTQTRPVTLRGLLARAGYAAWYQRRGLEDRMFFEVLRADGEREDEFVHNISERGVIINGVEIMWRRRGALRRPVIRDGKWELGRPDVFGDTLRISTWKEEAIFSREVKVERLEIR